MEINIHIPIEICNYKYIIILVNLCYQMSWNDDILIGVTNNLNMHMKPPSFASLSKTAPYKCIENLEH